MFGEHVASSGFLMQMSLVEFFCSKFNTYNCMFGELMFARVLKNWVVFHWSPGLNKQIKELYEGNGWGNIWQLHGLTLKRKPVNILLQYSEGEKIYKKF